MPACKRPAFMMSECVSLLTCQLAAVLCKSSKGWAEAHIKIARMTLTIKLDGNWSSFQLANSTPPLSVTGSAIAPSARMVVACAFHVLIGFEHARIHWFIGALLPLCKIFRLPKPRKEAQPKKKWYGLLQVHSIFLFICLMNKLHKKKKSSPRPQGAGSRKICLF